MAWVRVKVRESRTFELLTSLPGINRPFVRCLYDVQRRSVVLITTLDMFVPKRTNIEAT